MLIDNFDRRISYLRLSLTDRCNLRCQYCMPPEGLNWIPPDAILQDDEIIQLLSTVFLPLGLRKLRLTGGEPLLRKGLPDLIARISALPGISDLALTTNGIFLGTLAERLHAAGLSRINVSLDSLKADRFATITRGGDIAKVLAGIERAIEVGLDPVKVNVVIIPGTNDDEVLDFAEWTLRSPVHVRFIEMMHVGDRDFYEERRYVPVEELIASIRERHPLEPSAQVVSGNGPARIFEIPGARGKIGFISPMSHTFCDACNRIRLTADGQIKACLMRPEEQDLLGLLRQGGSPEAMQALVRNSLGFKPEHHEWGAGLPIHRTMSRIGG
jgi:cyclic pyranopterin phosphate synthase